MTAHNPQPTNRNHQMLALVEVLAQKSPHDSIVTILAAAGHDVFSGDPDRAARAKRFVAGLGQTADKGSDTVEELSPLDKFMRSPLSPNELKATTATVFGMFDTLDMREFRRVAGLPDSGASEQITEPLLTGRQAAAAGYLLTYAYKIGVNLDEKNETRLPVLADVWSEKHIGELQQAAVVNGTCTADEAPQLFNEVLPVVSQAMSDAFDTNGQAIYDARMTAGQEF